MASTSGRGTPVARLRVRRPVSVAALMRVAARQDALAAELSEFKEALARERAGIRAELTAITTRLDACESRIDDAQRRLDAGSALVEERTDALEGRTDALEERIDLVHDALAEAAALTRQSRRRLLRVEEALGVSATGDTPTGPGDAPVAGG